MALVVQGTDEANYNFTVLSDVVPPKLFQF